MKFFSAILFAASSLMCFAGTHSINVYQGGKKIGSGKFSVTKTTSEATQTLSMSANTPQGTVSIVQRQTFTKAGDPISSSFNEKVGDNYENVSIKFTGRTAHVTIESKEAGKKALKTVHSVKADGALPIKDSSNVWFVFTKPKVGATSKAMSFDWQTLQWTKNSSQFVGISKIKINGHTYNANEIKIIGSEETSEVYLDASGDLVKAEFSGLTLTRSN